MTNPALVLQDDASILYFFTSRCEITAPSSEIKLVASGRKCNNRKIHKFLMSIRRTDTRGRLGNFHLHSSGRERKLLDEKSSSSTIFFFYDGASPRTSSKTPPTPPPPPPPGLRVINNSVTTPDTCQPRGIKDQV